MPQAHDPLTIVNQGAEMQWYPRRMDNLALAEKPDPRVTQAERYRVSHPRVPRDRPLFKTDAEMRAQGWEPVRMPKFLRHLFSGLGAVALAMLALWVIGMVGGLK